MADTMSANADKTGHDISSSRPTSPLSPSSPTSNNERTRNRGSSGASTTGRLRRASLRFMESAPPAGMWDATAKVTAAAPSLAEIRKGSFGSNGWEGDGQRRNSTISLEKRLSRTNSNSGTMAGRNQQNPTSPTVVEREDEDDFPAGVFGRGEMADQSYVKGPKIKPKLLDEEVDEPQLARSEKASRILGGSPRPSSSSESGPKKQSPDADGVYPNGYKFPAKHTWGQATIIGLKAFWKFTCTPLGAVIVFYGLNVVAWGGMLFLLLIGGAPRMCYPEQLHGVKDCNNINSPRRIWLEWDSQILNALFCVTGFGLVPWRFRDLYYLLKFRLFKNYNALRTLAGFNKGWFRLPGSDLLPVVPRNSPLFTSTDTSTDEDLNNSSLPLPLSSTPNPPLTGIRAPPTAIWRLDFVIWAYVLNTFLQIVLSTFMWADNRFTRPSWSTGLFVALACIVAACGGLMVFLEGKKVKRMEGIPVDEEERIKDAEGDVEMGVGRREKERE
ncbi:hypothetical protein MMC06_005486 [Schaereria dolodes]|nr:hypothetical protein [Schaereria dolodes]